MADAGAQVHLAHPLPVKGFTYWRVKNDVRGASDLADLLRTGRVLEGWIAFPAVRECGDRAAPGQAGRLALRAGLGTLLGMLMEALAEKAPRDEASRTEPIRTGGEPATDQ